MNDDLLKLRHSYRSCLMLADETDSKKEDKLLRKEAAELLEELQRECPHDEIICMQRAYRGSEIDDYDDAHPEVRICPCCGVREEAYLGGQFEKLVNLPIARFSGQSTYNYANDPHIPQEISRPLKFLLSESLEVAREKGYKY